MMIRRLTVIVSALLAALFVAAPAIAQGVCPNNAIGTASTPITTLPYTIAKADFCLMKVFNSSANGVVNIPASGTAGAFFPNFNVQLFNEGVGTVTLTPLASAAGPRPTINGVTTIVLTTGQGATLAIGDDGNWYANANSGSKASLPLGSALAPGSITLGAPGLGYVQGDSITLACVGMTASSAPIVAVNAVGGGGAVAGLTVTNPGVITVMPNGGSCTFTQASTSGIGSGATVTGSFAPIAAFVSAPTLSTGGGVTNGNFWLGAETPLPTMGGPENTFFGDRAGGGFDTTSAGNAAFGHNAGGLGGGPVNTCAACNFNVFVGADAGRNILSTGGATSNNTVIGQNAGRVMNGAVGNTLAGISAGAALTTGGHNVLLGDVVAGGLTTGIGNVIIGSGDGTTLTTGNFNTLVGAGCNVAGATTGNTIGICAGNTGTGPVLSATGAGTPSTSASTIAGSLNIVAGIQNNGNLLVSPTGPTVASGGCTTGSAQGIAASNGSAAFEITLGGATCGPTITLAMPVGATRSWVCDAHDITTPASNVLDMTGTASTASVVLTNFVRTTGSAGNFTGADHLAVKCLPY